MSAYNAIKKVTQIVHCYGKYASTEPFLCILDDGTQAVIKYPNNPEGNLILINEYLAFRIASQIGLDIPQCGICKLDGFHSLSDGFSLYAKSKDCTFSERNYGMCFYSSFIERTIPLSTGMVPHISNRENFYTMVLFDHLVYNKDRHLGNLLICTNNPVRYFAIDHSHIFKNQAIWDCNTFSQGIVANDYLDKVILEWNADVYSHFFSYMDLNEQLLKDICLLMKHELTNDFFHKIISDIPEQWSCDVAAEDLEALEEYLCYRMKHLEEIAYLIAHERRA